MECMTKCNWSNIFSYIPISNKEKISEQKNHFNPKVIAQSE